MMIICMIHKFRGDLFYHRGLYILESQHSLLVQLSVGGTAFIQHSGAMQFTLQKCKIRENETLTYNVKSNRIRLEQSSN